MRAARTLARRERRLEDKLLFVVRALAVVVLAIIGATPLVQCSRLSLSRGSGGSLAVVVVLAAGVLLATINSFGAVIVSCHGVLRSGSSRHGNTMRA